MAALNNVSSLREVFKKIQNNERQYVANKFFSTKKCMYSMSVKDHFTLYDVTTIKQIIVLPLIIF